MLPVNFPDSDECAEDNNDCAEEAQCVDTVEGFECVCPDGYSGDGRTCSGTFSYDSVKLLNKKHSHSKLVCPALFTNLLFFLLNQ